MKLFNKFLVRRRDGSVPSWPWFVMGAADPAAPHALRAYADVAQYQHGMDPEYCGQIRKLAERFEEWQAENFTGDPDAGPHREDNDSICAMIPEYATQLPPEYDQRQIQNT
jgi:hypothetical protein